MLERYETGTGQKIMVHVYNPDCVISCVIHNPTLHHMQDWPTNWRDDIFLMERMCEHNVGHPDPDDIAYKDRKYGTAAAHAASVHGCDGCCRNVTA